MTDYRTDVITSSQVVSVARDLAGRGASWDEADFSATDSREARWDFGISEQDELMTERPDEACAPA